MELWLLFAAASAGILGIYDTLKKTSVKGNAVLPVLFFSTLAGSSVFLPLIILSWVNPATASSWGVFVPWSGWGVQWLILAKTLIIVCSWLLSFYALKHLPLSTVSPIRSSAPVVTLIAAMIFFQEMPNGLQWLGLSITIASFWWFSLAGKHEGIAFGNNRWVLCMILATILASFCALIDKVILERTSQIESQAWFTIYQSALLLPAYLYTRVYTSKGGAFTWKWTIPMIGIFLLLADFVYLQALGSEGAKVSIVSAVRRSNVLVSFAAGALLFGETNIKRKILPLIGIMGGVFLLLFSE